MKLPRPLRGIIPPMVTPLLDERTLDLGGLERLVEHLLEGGVHGLFLLGTTGEGPSLDPSLRHQLVERVCDQVAGRVPILVGVTDTVWTSALDVAETAFSAGAAALVAAPPFYLPISQSELLAHFERLARQLPLPLFLYNIPICTKTAFELETVRELVQLPNVVGMKDSSGDLEFFSQLAELTRSDELFSILIGPEQKLAEAMELGSHGGVCGGANMFPRLYVTLYEASMGQDKEACARLHARVMQVAASIYSVSDDPFGFIKATKTVLSLIGICDSFAAPPLGHLSGKQRGLLQSALGEFSRYLPVTNENR